MKAKFFTRLLQCMTWGVLCSCVCVPMQSHAQSIPLSTVQPRVTALPEWQVFSTTKVTGFSIKFVNFNADRELVVEPEVPAGENPEDYVLYTILETMESEKSQFWTNWQNFTCTTLGRQYPMFYFQGGIQRWTRLALVGKDVVAWKIHIYMIKRTTEKSGPFPFACSNGSAETISQMEERAVAKLDLVNRSSLSSRRGGTQRTVNVPGSLSSAAVEFAKSMRALTRNTFAFK